MAEARRKQETIEELRARHRKLETQRITAEADLKNANEQLERLKKEARERYGTDVLEELERTLKEMKDENERKRADYQRHLEKIEADLREVEERFKHAQVDKA